jgi:CheY-like chemotaxis protein
LRRLRAHAALAHIPALALSTSAEESAHYSEEDVQFDDYQLKFDRASMLHSIEKLAAAVDALAPAGATEGRA